MKKFVFLSLAALAVVMGGAVDAKAGLTGLTVHGEYYYPDSSTVFEDLGTAVVSPPATFSYWGFFHHADVAITDSQIIITGFDTSGYTTSSFNGPVFTFLSTSAITGVSINAGTTMVGLTASRVTGSQNGANYVVSLNFESLTLEIGEKAIIDVATSVNPPSGVPEPGSLTIWGLGIAAFVGMARRKRNLAA